MGMPRKKPKNPPVMSHEFVIQNHADILACVAIVIVLGLVSEVSSKNLTVECLITTVQCCNIQ